MPAAPMYGHGPTRVQGRQTPSNAASATTGLPTGHPDPAFARVAEARLVGRTGHTVEAIIADARDEYSDVEDRGVALTVASLGLAVFRSWTFFGCWRCPAISRNPQSRAGQFAARLCASAWRSATTAPTSTTYNSGSGHEPTGRASYVADPVRHDAPQRAPPRRQSMPT